MRQDETRENRNHRDFFISYTGSDRQWAEWIAMQVEQAGWTVFIQAWDIRPGSNFIAEMDDAAKRAERTLLVLSPAYLRSDYTFAEWAAAFRSDPKGTHKKLLPVRIEPCEVHGLLGPIGYIDLVSLDEERARERLLRGVQRGRAKPKSVVFPALRPPPALTTFPGSSGPLLDGQGSSEGSEVQSGPVGEPTTSTFAGSGGAHPTRMPSMQEQRNRVRFLAKLHSRYQDILESSLQGAVQIALRLHSKPDAVINSTRLRLRQANRPEQSLPPETTLLQIFDRTSGELLVLGEPGSGKTTQLLTVAEALYKRADRDEQALLPVIVNLSTWASARKPLAEWLIDEIVKSYDVPRKPITAWVEHEQLLPLLDGLDEVDEAALPACIEAINSYKQQHLLPLVVNCRSREYESQQHRLMLQDAVVIQPLEEEQVDAYFLAVGETFSGLRSFLHKNTALRALLSTPLMLHVVTLAYQDVAVQALLKEGTIQQQQIFEQYVQRMLTRPPMRFAPQAMLHWLSWLAQQMRTHNLTVFYLEHLQPEWLPPGRAQRIYDFLAVRCYGVLFGLLGGPFLYNIFLPFFLFHVLLSCLMGGLLGGLISGDETTIFQFAAVIQGWKRKGKKLVLLGGGCGVGIGISIGWLATSYTRYGYIFGISTGLCAFLLCSILEASKSTCASGTPLSKQNHMWWTRGIVPGLRRDLLLLGAIVGVLCWLSAALSYGLSDGSSTNGFDRRLYDVLSYGLNVVILDLGLISGIGAIIFALSHFGAGRGIILIELIGWSMRRFGQNLCSKAHLKMTLRLFLFLGLVFGLIIGLSTGLSTGLVGGPGTTGLITRLIGGPTTGPIAGLLAGLGRGLIAGLIAGLLTGLIAGLIAGLNGGLIYWLLLGLWGSLSQEMLDDHRRRIPNQGVKRSVRNATLLGLLAGVVGGLVIVCYKIFYGIPAAMLLGSGLINELRSMLNEGLSSGLIVAITGALLVWFLTGGLAGARHLLLRIQLTQANLLPWQAIRFLDEATHCILLSRDGGGYRFIHRLLLDYFASLETPSPEEASTGSAASSVLDEKV